MGHHKKAHKIYFILDTFILAILYALVMSRTRFRVNPDSIVA